MSENEENNEKANRRSSSFYVVMDDGQVHVCKGRVSLNRVMAKIDQTHLKMIIKGRTCRVVPKTSLIVET